MANFLQILGLAAAYFIVSKLGLLLAIPPGYATAIWPASGLALGCLLIFDGRLWPGVFLGSFLVSFRLPEADFDLTALVSPILVSPILVSAGIATGAVLQTLISAHFIRRRVGFPSALEDDLDVVRFLVIGAPLACLLNATIGSSSLFLAGAISLELYPLTWWTWWVWDSLGVLIFTPLVLIALASPREAWRPWALTVAVPLLIAFTLSVVVFRATSSDSWAILAGTSMFAGVLGGYLLMVSGRALKADRQIVHQNSKLQESSEWFRDLVDNSNQGYMIHRDHRVVYVNQAFVKLHGYDSAQELFDLATTQDLIAPESLDPNRYQQFVSGQVPTADVDYQGVRRDGSRFWVNRRSFAINWEGQLAVCTARVDIGDRIESERRLAEAKNDADQARQEAEAANRAKSEFLSSMSHELRTPLNSIIGFTQVLDSDPREDLTDRQRRGVETILMSGQHLLNLINQLLAIPSIEAGRWFMQIEPVDTVELLQHCMTITEALSSPKSITLTDDFEDPAFPPVRADLTSLKQITLNLLSNAVKYNGTGGTITVSAATTERATMRITVADTGHGIAPDQVSEIFEAFMRVGERKSAIEGARLGLSISKKLVEQMNGTIGVDSILGQGSSFWSELPLAEHPAQSAGDESAHDEDKPAATLAYDQALGPLRQSTVIETSSICFHWWPGDFEGAVANATRGQVLMVTDGAAEVESGAGEKRIFRPGDILEFGQLKSPDHRIRAVDGAPFCAAIIHLDSAADDERSHFHHGALDYVERGDGSLQTEGVAISRFQYVYAASDLRYDFHNAPQRQIVIPLTGGIKGENGDGTTCIIPIGGVYFGEDITGEGHITHALNNSIRFSILAHLA